MNRTKNTRVGVIACVAAAALLLMAGCANDRTGGHNEAFFPGEGPSRSTSRMMQAQAASGARADSTLRADHFDGGQLNSLGRQKLDLMLVDDDSIEPLVVYVDVDEASMVRRTRSAAAYLADKGLAHSQMKFESGENPANFSPVAPTLAQLRKAESGSAGEGQTNSTAAGPGGATDGDSMTGYSGE